MLNETSLCVVCSIEYLCAETLFIPVQHFAMGELKLFMKVSLFLLPVFLKSVAGLFVCLFVGIPPLKPCNSQLLGERVVCAAVSPHLYTLPCSVTCHYRNYTPASGLSETNDSVGKKEVLVQGIQSIHSLDPQFYL